MAASSWAVFAVSFTLYCITCDPGVSYWDCAEYVTVASRLEVGHPPGNPFWMLAMRVATIPFDPGNHAYVINLCSGLLMAFASFFLCRLIFIPLRLFFEKKYPQTPSLSADISTSFIAAGAALCFSFCDSAWFSAVEAEVYAMSTFLSSLSLWLMMIWWFDNSSGRRFRLLVLTAYLLGLSLGVHQLNLLLIPVFALIIFYRYNTQRVNVLKVIALLVASCLAIGIILMGMIPLLFYGAGESELYFVNNRGFGYDSGIIFFGVAIAVILFRALAMTRLYKSVGSKLSLALWMFTFILIGFSSYSVILIRSKAATPVNEGSPDNIFALSSYFAREQYPSTPLLYGETPYSKPIFEETFVEGKPEYRRYKLRKVKALYQPVTPHAALFHRSGMLSRSDSLRNEAVRQKGTGYLLSDYKFKQVLTPELDMWLPRITSKNPYDIEAYEDWSGMESDNMERIPVSEAVDSTGQFVTRLNSEGERPEVLSYRPTYLQNLRYFLAYQSYYMYFRYLFWNFVGRQNDFHSMGEIEHGNFITGIKPLDNLLIGNTDKYPGEILNDNKGYNRYFGIPFIIGILGILWLAGKNRIKRRVLTLISLIFLMTGLVIVVYLNQTPGEPRERDYTFLMSYMAFAMWIGAGLTAIAVFIFRFLKRSAVAVVTLCLLALAPATLMALENFDDHDRRGRYQPEFFASSLLDFPLPAIIFSQGDNSTFPLWYASEVEEKGSRHTPVDISYLSLPSYVINLKKQGDKGLTLNAPTPEIAYNKYALTKISDSSTPLDLKLLLENLYNSGEGQPVLGSSYARLKRGENDSVTINLKKFTNGGTSLTFRQLMLLDILASAQSDSAKVLFFPYLIERNFYRPLEKVLKPVLFGKIYAPSLSDSATDELTRRSVDLERERLRTNYRATRYIDPVIADRIVRYRGELIIAAAHLLSRGDTVTPRKISEIIEEYFPYEKVLPGTFTQADSTFYEGKEYVRLLNAMSEVAGDATYADKAAGLQELMDKRNREWTEFYYSLTPSQRMVLSNRSKRLLIK